MRTIIPSTADMYGVAQNGHELVMLSKCCGKALDYVGHGRRVICTDCGTQTIGYSDYSMGIYQGIPEIKRWVSAWTGIDKDDITVEVDD